VQLLQRDVTPQEQTKINILEQKTFKENYLINEKKFHQLIEKSLSAKYKIYNDFRVENNEYDLLLKSPLMMESDYIIDIKYSEARIGQTYLRSCINQINSSLKYYKERIKGNVKARIVLLLTKKAIQEKSLNVKAVYNYTIDLVDYENKNLRSSDVYIAIFEVEKMESYSEIEIIEKLKL
jgi:hypothetical protein